MIERRCKGHMGVQNQVVVLLGDCMQVSLLTFGMGSKVEVPLLAFAFCGECGEELIIS